MRFIKSTRHPFNDTSRKRAALARKQKAEREALPLFANQIAASQKSPNDVMQARAAAWAVAGDIPSRYHVCLNRQPDRHSHQDPAPMTD